METLAGGAIFWIWNDAYNDVMYGDRDFSISPASGEGLLDIADDLHNNGVSKALFGLFFEADSCLSEPLYSFTEGNYKRLKQAILESYKTITAVHEKTALLPMTDFQILSDDYMLQCSVFGNTYKITANFSNEPRKAEGKTVLPKDFLLEEM